MNKETYKQAQKIEAEVEQLKTIQREIISSPGIVVCIGSTKVQNNHLNATIGSFVASRIKQLDKEFEEL